MGAVLRRRGDTALEHDRAPGTMAAELEAVAPGRLIDLVVLDLRDPMLCHRVLAEGMLVLDAGPDRRVDFESSATVRDLDWLPTWRIAAPHAIAGVRRRLERGA